MINSERLDRDWYEGIVQKLKWNLSFKEDQSGGPPATAPSRLPQNEEASGEDELLDLEPDDGFSSLEDPEKELTKSNHS